MTLSRIILARRSVISERCLSITFSARIRRPTRVLFIFVRDFTFSLRIAMALPSWFAWSSSCKTLSLTSLTFSLVLAVSTFMDFSITQNRRCIPAGHSPDKKSSIPVASLLASSNSCIVLGGVVWTWFKLCFRLCGAGSITFSWELGS